MSDRSRTSAVVRRVLPARPEIVYDEWLDPEALLDFMCPLPARATKIECDPRVGGRLLIVMSEGSNDHEIRGEFVELDRPNRLRFTWSHEGVTDSLVTIRLEPHGRDQTLMTIDHSRLPEAEVPDHASGWTEIAAQLTRRLGSSERR